MLFEAEMTGVRGNADPPRSEPLIPNDIDQGAPLFRHQRRESGVCEFLSGDRLKQRRGETGESAGRKRGGAPARFSPRSAARGMTASGVIDGPIAHDSFHAYVEQTLAPTLRPGALVVLDDLASHRGDDVRLAIERAGETPRLPPYSADFNPVELRFSKLKAILRALLPPLWLCGGRELTRKAPAPKAPRDFSRTPQHPSDPFFWHETCLPQLGLTTFNGNASLFCRRLGSKHLAEETR